MNYERAWTSHIHIHDLMLKNLILCKLPVSLRSWVSGYAQKTLFITLLSFFWVLFCFSFLFWSDLLWMLIQISCLWHNTHFYTQIFNFEHVSALTANHIQKKLFWWRFRTALIYKYLIIIHNHQHIFLTVQLIKYLRARYIRWNFLG